MNQSPDIPDQETLRRSSRTRANPAYLAVYNITIPPSLNHSTKSSNACSVLYPIADYLSDTQFSDLHYAFRAAITKDIEPKTYMQDSKVTEWQKAMKAELQDLEKTNT